MGMDLRERLEEETRKAEEKQPVIDRDKNRLALHLMPPVGWINDPNGLCQFNGVYHVFYQYSPIDPNGSFKAWGHYVSKDQLHWEQLPVALYPDKDFDRDGVYSGSALIEDGGMYLFYTGNVTQLVENDPDQTYSGREANTVLVTSRDGINFSKKKLLMTNADYPSEYTCHIRDPKVWKSGDKYYMVQGGRKKLHPEGTGAINSEKSDYGTVLIFESDNLVDWHFLKDVTTKERFGYMWECPDYFKVDNQPVLSVSPQGLEHEEYRYQNVYQSGYFLLDEELISDKELTKDNIIDEDMRTDRVETNKLTPDTDKFYEWDYGFDFYAPQTYCDERGRRIIIGWAGIGDADYDNAPTVEAGWQHALTLPREISLSHGKLCQNPLEELKELRKSKVEFDNSYSAVDRVFELELDKISAGSMVRIACGQENFTVRYEDKVLSFTITEAAGRGRKIRKIKIDALRNMRLIVDNSLVEIYMNDGEYVLTSKFYFAKNERKIETEGIGRAVLWYLKGLEIVEKSISPKGGLQMPDYTLYAITDRKWLTPGETLADAVEKAIKGGATIIQLREKTLTGEALEAEAINVQKVCRKYNVPFIINDDVELAKRIDADGVHVGQDDMELSEARAILGEDKIIGVTAKTIELARKAMEGGASYLGSGAVFGSTTKTDARPMTLDMFQSICESVNIPVVAIGGIDEANIDKLRGRKMSGFAVVSAIFAKDDIKAAAEQLSGLAHDLLRTDATTNITTDL